MAKKKSDKEQSQCFIDKAKELGADDVEAFERAFKKIVPPKKKNERHK